MHRMVISKREAGNYDLGRPAGCDLSCGQLVTHNAIVHLDKKPAVVERDTRAAGAALFASLAEAHGEISLAVAGGILESHQEPAWRRSVVGVVATTPGVDIDHAV